MIRRYIKSLLAPLFSEELDFIRTYRERIVNIYIECAQRETQAGKILTKIFRGDELVDLDYPLLKNVWRTNEELVKFNFPIIALSRDEFILKPDTTHGIILAMAREGYRCTIVENLLEDK